MIHSQAASIKLLEIISKQLPFIKGLFETDSAAFKQLQAIANSSQDLNENEDFLNSELNIHYLQFCLLLGLSMFQGVFVPSMKDCKLDDNRFSITWDSLTKDDFTFGCYDKRFIKFASYYQDRLSSKPQKRESIPSGIFQGILQFLQSYILVLDSVEEELDKMLSSKANMFGIINSDMQRPLLFIIIACLPKEAMNALFVYIQQYFPEELEVTTALGRKVNVVALFETQSVNIDQLCEKNNIYFDLYFDRKKPIVREITRSKTVEYLKKCLTNDKVYEETNRNLSNISELQIKIRKRLYQYFIDHLELVLGE